MHALDAESSFQLKQNPFVMFDLSDDKKRFFTMYVEVNEHAFVHESRANMFE